MAIGFKGFNEQILTFKTISAEKGYPVKQNASGDLINCSANEDFMGICTQVNSDFAGVQMGGYIEMQYSTGSPEYGLKCIQADGTGKVKVSDSGNKKYQIIKIDTENKMIGFIL